MLSQSLSSKLSTDEDDDTDGVWKRERKEITIISSSPGNKTLYWHGSFSKTSTHPLSCLCRRGSWSGLLLLFLLPPRLCAVDLYGGRLPEELGCDGHAFSYELVVDALLGDQHDQWVATVTDQFHHLLVAALLHIHSIHLHHDVIVLQTCSVGCSTLHHLGPSEHERFKLQWLINFPSSSNTVGTYIIIMKMIKT